LPLRFTNTDNPRKEKIIYQYSRAIQDKTGISLFSGMKNRREVGSYPVMK